MRTIPRRTRGITSQNARLMSTVSGSTRRSIGMTARSASRRDGSSRPLDATRSICTRGCCAVKPLKRAAMTRLPNPSEALSRIVPELRWRRCRSAACRVPPPRSARPAREDGCRARSERARQACARTAAAPVPAPTVHPARDRRRIPAEHGGSRPQPLRARDHEEHAQVVPVRRSCKRAGCGCIIILLPAFSKRHKERQSSWES